MTFRIRNWTTGQIVETGYGQPDTIGVKAGDEIQFSVYNWHQSTPIQFQKRVPPDGAWETIWNGVSDSSGFLESPRIQVSEPVPVEQWTRAYSTVSISPVLVMAKRSNGGGGLSEAGIVIGIASAIALGVYFATRS